MLLAVFEPFTIVARVREVAGPAYRSEPRLPPAVAASRPVAHHVRAGEEPDDLLPHQVSRYALKNRVYHRGERDD
ncbi:MAG: hypothetical protein ABIK62_02465 [candidate division WOR-3 bacterium]